MKTSIALGTFDGVHAGHRAVLNLPKNSKKIAVSFKIPPKAVLTGESSLLITPENKCRILKELGIDETVLLDFSVVKEWKPEEFLEFLKEKYNPSFISCGFNYHFGKFGKGDAEMLGDFCEKNGIGFSCHEMVTENGQAISSSYIRGLIGNGEIDKANAMLFEPFSFESEVIEGDKRGRTMGFPTVNQRYPEGLAKLKFGVYKTKVSFDDKEYFGVTNIGIRPTFETDYIISETFIKDFSGDLYGKNIKVTPIQFLREEKKFSSLEELIQQIKSDINS